MSAAFKTALLAGLLLAGMAQPASAVEPRCFSLRGESLFGVCCGCCPDDYCCKPLPPVACPPAQCEPDDYYRKPLPCIRCLPPSCEPACYDVKRLPPIPKCCESWYRCK